MVRIAAFLVAGILVAIYFPGAFGLQQAVILSTILVFVYFLITTFFRGRKTWLDFWLYLL
jgi:predicted benzoate:H+ symporter BenE